MPVSATVHSIFHVWKAIFKEMGKPESHLFTMEKKPARCAKYVQDKVFAIDFDEKSVRVSRCLANVRRFLIPRFDAKRMNQIGEETRLQVQRARAARQNAQALLAKAKLAVEVAIERGGLRL